MMLLLAALAGVAIFVVGYNVGRARFSSESRSNRRIIRENVLLTSANEAYKSGLNAISAGRGGLPEITAASALAEARSYEKEIN